VGASKLYLDEIYMSRRSFFADSHDIFYNF